MLGIELNSVNITLGNRLVIDGINLRAERGSLVGLIGPNGAGKTTLLRSMSGLQKIDSGEVRIDGTLFPEIEKSQLAKNLAYLPHGAPCHWPLTLERVVALGRLPHQGKLSSLNDLDSSAIEMALAKAEVENLRSRPVHSLSSGERARVMIARALAQKPDILLADEPTVALDPYHQLRVLEILRDHAHNDSVVIAVLHDLSLAEKYCDKLILISEGKVLAKGCPEEVLTAPILREAYNVNIVPGNSVGGYTFSLPT